MMFSIPSPDDDAVFRIPDGLFTRIKEMSDELGQLFFLMDVHFDAQHPEHNGDQRSEHIRQWLGDIGGLLDELSRTRQGPEQPEVID
jgi:hypothetical protein